MRINNLLYLLTGIIICSAISACQQKQPGLTVTPSAENKSVVPDSGVMPVTVIATNDAIEGRQPSAKYYPKTFTLNGFDTTATPIAVYGASRALWLALLRNTASW